MQERIQAEIRLVQAEGRITCTLAREIAERIGVSYAEVGSAANQMKIKITACELGCF